MRRRFARSLGIAVLVAVLAPAAARAASAPGAPTNVTARPGNARVTVRWHAPASDGGAAITGYTATASGGGHTCTTTGALSCVVTGLTNGTSYTFTVTATNSVGTGPASAASNAATPAAVPGAPTHVVAATAGSQQVKVTWTAPASDGGARITKYTVAASGSGGQSCSWTSGTLSCTVTGLVNGTSYTFTVTATNSTGDGPASAASNAVTPVGPSAAPTGVSAVAGDQQATVSCTAPASNGGAAITAYTATASPGGAHASAATCPITVTGLTDGTSYTFKVTATSSLGTSVASAASNAVVPRDTHAPSPPSGLVGTIAHGTLTLDWHASTDNVGVVRYELYLNATPIVSVPASATTAATRAFEPHGQGAYTVTAFDAAGNQSAKSGAVAVRPSPRPKNVPKIVPRWAWALFAWQQHHKGARPKTPKKLPAWYAVWKHWRLAPFQIVT